MTIDASTRNRGETYVDVSDDGEVGLVPEGYRPPPAIRSLAVADVFLCLNKGVRDFQRYGVFFACFYVVGGLGLVSLALYTRNEQAIFPMIAGFLLIGPITAVGLYDISRRLEAGVELRTRDILLSFTRHGGTQLMLFGATLVFAMMAWLLAARLIYALAFGMQPLTIFQILAQALSSPSAAWFLIVGNIVGAALAVVVFAMSVVAVPYLLDRDVDFMTALVTSIRAVIRNPLAMLTFAFIIGCMIGASLLTAFLGLVVAMPVIGHATWHLYRMTVDDEAIDAAQGDRS
jgi:uncharacterized membrane protein